MGRQGVDFIRHGIQMKVHVLAQVNHGLGAMGTDATSERSLLISLVYDHVLFQIPPTIGAVVALHYGPE